MHHKGAETLSVFIDYTTRRADGMTSDWRVNFSEFLTKGKEI